MDSRRYRVAQWGAGMSGKHCLRAIIEHPLYDLVGVWVYSDEKVGRDAGDLCGTTTTGVMATQDIEVIIAAKPDCVVYMADRLETGVLRRLLESGSNVVTALVEFNYRDCMEPETRRELEAACQRGNTSLYSTGSTPGWFTENLPLAVSALHRRIDCITLTDTADMSLSNAPHMLFDVLPFGWDPAKADIASIPTPKIAPGSLSMTAAALGLVVDEFVTTRDFALTRSRVKIPAGTLEPGTIGAWRQTLSGLRNGKAVICRNSILYVTKDVEPAWELRGSGQHLRVDGDMPLEVFFSIPLPVEEERRKVAAGLTANPLVNAVPYICAAQSGIVQTDELPLIIGWFGS